jgi:hypothetical protein
MTCLFVIYRASRRYFLFRSDAVRLANWGTSKGAGAHKAYGDDRADEQKIESGSKPKLHERQTVRRACPFRSMAPKAQFGIAPICAFAIEQRISSATCRPLEAHWARYEGDRETSPQMRREWNDVGLMAFIEDLRNAEDPMKTLAGVAAAAAGIMFLASGPVLAQGASKSAPGQQMQQTPEKEKKGASSFAPGQRMQQTPGKEPRGASTLAPGQTTGQGTKKSNK